jgi:hypothetical protein
MQTANLSVWGCRCWDTKNNRYVILSYVRETKAEAYEICSTLNPHYDIESVYHITDY